MNAPGQARRKAVISFLFVVVAAVLVAVFHRPLVAWFTGTPVSGGEGTSIAVHAGPFSLRAALDPDPPRQTGDALVLEIEDVSGKPVDDATVVVAWDMPAMGAMSEMKGSARVSHESAGSYRAAFDLPMSGSWTLRTSIKAASGEATQDLGLTVGTAGLSPGSTSGNAPAGEAGAPSGGAIDHYTCSMHPSVNQPGPGTCPVCGMNLVPVTKEQQEQGVITIDEMRRQLIGVRTAAVIEGSMRWTFRAVGLVAYDESTLADVSLKVRGWITRLYVSETGQRVARGQPLFLLYSPELYNAEQDFLLATTGATATAMRMEHPDGGRVEALGTAARQRLRLLGLDDALIDDLAKKGAPSESVAFRAPASGFVIEKNVVEGASVEAGARLYRIAALNKVWIEADIYEADLANVRVGQHAAVTLDYLPGRSYDAKVAYLYPYLDTKTRTGRVRIELANKGLELRPGMFANVELAEDLGQRMQVPASAVVYTGPRRLVFVDLGQGRFRPQEVHVGSESNGMYEVLDGLHAGDVVATSGMFLIAAEARIRTAAKYWEPTAEATDSGATPPVPSSSEMPMQGTAPMRMPIAPPMAPTPSIAPSAGSPAAPAPTVFTCPMHPEVQRPDAGKCPKCGMELVPKGAR
jgi:Cu(I)/Ag(I) efflux system membrane fusion protein